MFQVVLEEAQIKAIQQAVLSLDACQVSSKATQIAPIAILKCIQLGCQGSIAERLLITQAESGQIETIQAISKVAHDVTKPVPTQATAICCVLKLTDKTPCPMAERLGMLAVRSKPLRRRSACCCNNLACCCIMSALEKPPDRPPLLGRL